MAGFPLKLVSGYNHFRTGTYKAQKATLKRLGTEGQAPHTLVIACCDSRCTPETIFQAEPGELFVIRHVANFVPSYQSGAIGHSTASALEFGIKGLGVRDILVLGHSRCGGVNAALNSKNEPLSQDDFVGQWVDLLAASARSIINDESLTQDQHQKALEQLSIRQSIDNLATYPFIAEALKAQRLGLHGAWFDIAEGTLSSLNSQGDFVLVDLNS